MNDPASSDYRQIEKALLNRSHNSQKTQELLDNRYSVSGTQKPFLILTLTNGTSATSTTNANPVPRQKCFPTKPKKQRLSRLNHARTSLSQFIKSAQTAQAKVEAQIRHQKKSKSKAQNITITPEYLIENKVPSYDQYISLHQLWDSYISTLLFTNNSMPATTQHSLVLAGKLASADFHGAQLKVISAKNPSMVGLQGIVIWEARTNFVMVVPAKPESTSCREQIGGLRIVEKRGSLFQFTASNGTLSMDFDIVGSRFLYRTADRSGRKFKARSVDDL